MIEFRNLVRFLSFNLNTGISRVLQNQPSQTNFRHLIKTNQDSELFRGRIQLMTKTAMTIPPGIRDVIILDHILLNIKPIVLQSRERTNLSGIAFQFLLCKITFKLNQKHRLVFQTIHSRM